LFKPKHVAYFTLYYELCMTNLKKKYISIFDKTKGMSHLKMTGVALNSALVVFI
jgi:hypothetical protein